MSNDKPQTFEQKLARIEQIVKQLEAGNVELDAAVALFREGKGLADECDALLKGAQTQLTQAMGSPVSAPQAAGSDPEDQIPF
ncbi:MAG: exodeoxyribonuclease VII small subunit [Vulcanimicrobiaceae bacterium]